MVSVKDLPAIAQDAIRANFAMRNARVFDTPSRHLRRRATQRQKIREWVAVLRIVRNPSMAEYVQQEIKEVGPLMAHDLRRRVIYAGLESKFASLGRQS